MTNNCIDDIEKCKTSFAACRFDSMTNKVHDILVLEGKTDYTFYSRFTNKFHIYYKDPKSDGDCEVTELVFDLFPKGKNIYGIIDPDYNNSDNIEPNIRNRIHVIDANSLETLLVKYSDENHNVANAIAAYDRSHLMRKYHCADEKTKAKYRLKGILDPSGFVYEAVESNRIEGATATIVYAEGGAEWDATEYAQVNTQITDKDGTFAWDVPQGTYKVKIEMDGYDTAYSDALPVPPPQLDVRIPLVTKKAPEVESLNAYTDYIEIIFTQYMKIDDKSEIVATVNGKSIAASSFEWQDAEESPSGEKYAKVVRIPVPAGTKVGDTLDVQISKAKNYAGIPMSAAYSEKAKVTHRPTEIILNYETVLTMQAGSDKNITVRIKDIDTETKKISLVYKKDYNWSEDSSTSMLRKILLWVYGSLALSFSAQVMVMPLVAYYFHSLPCYGLLSSLVVSVTAMIIVGLSFVFLTSLFLPFTLVSEALAYMLSAVAHFQNVFLEHVTALPYSVIADVNINIWQLVIIYVIIFCLSRIAFILQQSSCRLRY